MLLPRSWVVALLAAVCAVENSEASATYAPIEAEHVATTEISNEPQVCVALLASFECCEVERFRTVIVG